MTDLYLDHDISAYMTVPLRGRGHSVLTTDDLGRSSASDDELLLEAARISRIFITHNLRDFALLHNAWHRWSAAWGIARSHTGILVIPQPPRLMIPDAVSELDAFLIARPTLIGEMHIFRVNTGWRQAMPPA